MKIAFLSDVHLGCERYSVKRASDFFKQFKKAVEKIIALKADVAIIAGDIFDIHGAKSLRVDTIVGEIIEAVTVLELLKKAAIPVYAIAGNHEYGRGREGAPLKLLDKLGLLTFIEKGSVTITNSGEKIYLFGQSYSTSKKRLLKSISEQTGDGHSKRVLLVHQMLLESKRIPTPAADISVEEIMKNSAVEWDVIVAGHQHNPEVYKVKNTQVIVPGSLEIWKADEAKYSKGFYLYDSKSEKLDFVEMPPTRKVFYKVFIFSDELPATIENAVSSWVKEIVEPEAIVVAKLKGSIAKGHFASEINRNRIIQIAKSKNCLFATVDMGDLEIYLKGVEEATKHLDLNEFLRKEFGKDYKRVQEIVDLLIDSSQTKGPTLLLDKLIGDSTEKVIGKRWTPLDKEVAEDVSA